jgi:hypothetical protein
MAEEEQEDENNRIRPRERACCQKQPLLQTKRNLNSQKRIREGMKPERVVERCKLWC